MTIVSRRRLADIHQLTTFKRRRLVETREMAARSFGDGPRPTPIRWVSDLEQGDLNAASNTRTAITRSNHKHSITVRHTHKVYAFDLSELSLGKVHRAEIYVFLRTAS